MRLSTETTPGADQACRAASSFSAQDRTVPLSMTLPPSTSTVMFLASSSAVRTNASSIFFFSSDGETFGLTTIRFVTPLTPATLAAAAPAAAAG